MANQIRKADAVIESLEERQIKAEAPFNPHRGRFNVFTRGNNPHVDTMMAVHQRAQTLLEKRTRYGRQAYMSDLRRHADLLVSPARAALVQGATESLSDRLVSVVTGFIESTIQWVGGSNRTDQAYGRLINSSMRSMRADVERQIATAKTTIRTSISARRRADARQALKKLIRTRRGLRLAARHAETPALKSLQIIAKRDDIPVETEDNVRQWGDKFISEFRRLSGYSKALLYKLDERGHRIGLRDDVALRAYHTQLQAMLESASESMRVLMLGARARLEEVEAYKAELIQAKEKNVPSTIAVVEVEVQRDIAQQFKALTTNLVDRAAAAAWRQAQRAYSLNTAGSRREARSLLRTAALIAGDTMVMKSGDSDEAVAEELALHARVRAGEVGLEPNKTVSRSWVRRLFPTRARHVALPKLDKAVSVASFVPSKKHLPVRHAVSAAGDMLYAQLMQAQRDIQARIQAAESERSGVDVVITEEERVLAELFRLLDTGELSVFIAEGRQLPGAALPVDIQSYVASFPELGLVAAHIKLYHNTVEAAYKTAYTKMRTTALRLSENPMATLLSTKRYNMPLKNILTILLELGFELDNGEALREYYRSIGDEAAAARAGSFVEMFFPEQLWEGESYQSMLRRMHRELLNLFQGLCTVDFGMKAARKRWMLEELAENLNKMALTTGAQMPKISSTLVDDQRMVFKEEAAKPLSQYDAYVYAMMPKLKVLSEGLSDALAIGQGILAFAAMYGMLIGFSLALWPAVAIAGVVTLLTVITNRILFKSGIDPILAGMGEAYAAKRFGVDSGEKVQLTVLEKFKKGFSVAGAVAMGVAMGALTFKGFAFVLSFMPALLGAYLIPGLFAVVTAFGVACLLGYAAQQIIVRRNLGRSIKRALTKFFAPAYDKKMGNKSWYELSPGMRVLHCFRVAIKAVVMLVILAAAAMMMYVTVTGWQASIADFFAKMFSVAERVANIISNFLVYYTGALMFVGLVFNVTPFAKLGMYLGPKVANGIQAFFKSVLNFPRTIKHAWDYVFNLNGRRAFVAKRRGKRRLEHERRQIARRAALRGYFSKEGKKARRHASLQYAASGNSRRQSAYLWRRAQSWFLNIAILVNVLGYGVLMGTSTAVFHNGFWPSVLPQAWEGTAMGAFFTAWGSFMVNMNAKNGVMAQTMGTSKQSHGPVIDEYQTQSAPLAELAEESAQSQVVAEKQQQYASAQHGFFAVSSVVAGSSLARQLKSAQAKVDTKNDYIVGEQSRAQVLSMRMGAQGLFKKATQTSQVVTQAQVREALESAERNVAMRAGRAILGDAETAYGPDLGVTRTEATAAERSQSEPASTPLAVNS